MEPNRILKADVLDIIFEGRNKDYGAYDLRRTYNRRLFQALFLMSLLLLTLGAGYALSNLHPGKRIRPAKGSEVFLLPPVEPVPKTIPPPALPHRTIPPRVETHIFTPPLITKEQDIKKEDRPPEQAELENTKIGTVNVEGPPGEDITSPPVSDGKGVTPVPVDEASKDIIFTKVEIESEYPGGAAQWLRYLTRNMRYPEEALNTGIQGTVIVKFVVDREGHVSDAEALSGPMEGGLREEAVRVIMKSGKWTPAIQNGRTVKSYKQQPIAFRVNPQ